MIKAMDIGIAGMKAMASRMAVHSNNVANANTDGFRKSRTVLAENQTGGVSTRVEKVDTPGPVIQDQGGERELSNVDLAEEIVGTIPTRQAYTANLKMIRIADEMTGSVLDIKG